MLISDKHRFIFVHVQKTAGLSVERVLRSHFPDIRRWHGRRGHAINGVEEIGLEVWSDYYCFSFVRNPWDRMVSWYTMIKRGRAKLSWYRKWQRAPFKIKLWNEVVQKAEDFDSFLYRCTDVIFDKGCQKSFAFNQIDYLADHDGQLLVDFVGRFETLSEDADKLFARLGLTGVKLPHINQTSHDHYSHWYNTHTRDLVAERFSRDIAAFGFTFEGTEYLKQ